MSLHSSDYPRPDHKTSLGMAKLAAQLGGKLFRWKAMPTNLPQFFRRVITARRFRDQYLAINHSLDQSRGCWLQKDFKFALITRIRQKVKHQPVDLLVDDITSALGCLVS